MKPTDEVLPILYLPASLPEFERRLRNAALEAPGRDWDEAEKEHLRRNPTLRNSLIEEVILTSEGAWTKPNLTFLRHHLVDYKPNDDRQLSDQDDGAQRLKENPPEPELTPEQVEALRQEHEGFLTQLEALAVCAIAKGYWDDVYDFINFHAPESEES